MSQRSDKSSEDSEMIVSEASALVAAAAGPREWGDNRKSWLARAAYRLGFSYSRTRSIFYREARVIRAEEWIALNEAVSRLTTSAVARQGEINALTALERAAAASPRDRSRPLGMDDDATGKARHRP